MKRITAALLLASLLFCASCSEAAFSTVTTASSAQTESRVYITDFAGNEYTLTSAPENIYCASPSGAEILVSLSCSRGIKAADVSSAQVGGIQSDSALLDPVQATPAKLRELKIDAVFASAGKITAPAEAELRGAGINVFIIAHEGGIQTAEANIRLISAIMFRSNAGDRIIQTMRDEISIVKALSDNLLEKKRVYAEYGTAQNYFGCGADSYIHELLTISGGINVIGDRSGSIKLTAQELVELDTGVIISFVTGEDFDLSSIRRREGYENIPAYKRGEIYIYGEEIPLRPAPSVTEALYRIATLLDTAGKTRTNASN